MSEPELSAYLLYNRLRQDPNGERYGRLAPEGIGFDPENPMYEFLRDPRFFNPSALALTPLGTNLYSTVVSEGDGPDWAAVDRTTGRGQILNDRDVPLPENVGTWAFMRENPSLSDSEFLRQAQLEKLKSLGASPRKAQKAVGKGSDFDKSLQGMSVAETSARAEEAAAAAEAAAIKARNDEISRRVREQWVLDMLKSGLPAAQAPASPSPVGRR